MAGYFTAALAQRVRRTSTPLALWLACLLAIRNQRILTAFTQRQAEDLHRAAAGLPPKTRKRRRRTLASLAAVPL